MKLRLASVALLVAPAVLALVPDKQLPAYTGYVVDKASILDQGAVEQIRATASRLDHAGVAQIAICTVPDLGDWSVEEFAVDLFRKWGLGHGKKRADGLLLVLVPGKPGHRKIKVEVGQALEGILPDGKVGALIDQYAAPAVRRNDYGDAAVKLLDAFAGVLESNAGAGGELAPAAGGMRGGRGVGAARAPMGVGGLGAEGAAGAAGAEVGAAMGSAAAAAATRAAAGRAARSSQRAQRSAGACPEPSKTEDQRRPQPVEHAV